jgi:CRP-like cAMP-binding protein
MCRVLKLGTVGPMFDADFPDSFLAERWLATPGEVLFRRSSRPPWVFYLESGRVALGLMEEGAGLAHQLGSVEGPAWLELGSALLALPQAVDAVADGNAALRRVPLAAYRTWVGSLPKLVQSMLNDVAAAHRQQSDLAVSRLAKDAEARCAEWLLRHAQTSAHGSVAVMLQERKRSIAAQLGIAPETLSRVLRHLRERSLISGSGRVVNLVDPIGLRSLAGV